MSADDPFDNYRYSGLVVAHVFSNHVLLTLCLGDKELRAQVILCDVLVVYDGKRADARKDEVFGHFICKSFHSDEEDIC